MNVHLWCLYLKGRWGAGHNFVKAHSAVPATSAQARIKSANFDQEGATNGLTLVTGDALGVGAFLAYARARVTRTIARTFKRRVSLVTGFGLVTVVFVSQRYACIGERRRAGAWPNLLP